MVGDTFYYFRGTPEMRGCSLERDDMHALPNPKNISLIHRIPETGSMAQMRLTSHQQLQRHIFRFRRVGEDLVGFVVRLDEGADARCGFLDVSLQFVIAGDLAVGAFAAAGDGGGDEGFGEVELVDVGFDGVRFFTVVADAVLYGGGFVLEGFGGEGSEAAFSEGRGESLSACR